MAKFVLTRTPTPPAPLLSQVPRNSSSPVSKVAFSGRCLLVSVSPMTSYLIFLACTIRSSMEASDASVRALKIPQWVRDVNEDKQYRDSETIGYHYYTYKKPLPFLNESQIENFPALVYFIAQTPTYFSGNITSRQSVSRWIVALDHIKVEMPRTHSALDELISSSSNCSERFLVFISNERRCPLQYWNNVARTASMYTGVRPVYLSAPLPAAMSVVLYRRLPLLDEATCRQMFLLHQSSYSILFQDYAPRAITNEFWALIDDKIAAVEPENTVSIAGYLNGHVGEKNDGYRCHGGFGYGMRNDDGERILDYAQSHSLVISNTKLRKRPSHLVSYHIGSNNTQIDYVLARHGDQKLVTEAKVVPYETATSHHRTLICTLKIAPPNRAMRTGLNQVVETKRKEVAVEEVRSEIREQKRSSHLFIDNKTANNWRSYREAKNAARKAAAVGKAASQTLGRLNRSRNKQVSADFLNLGAIAARSLAQHVPTSTQHVL
ncbi:hypothetical protein Y032_0048g1700 [Ancylostoma ceylanicum]|nr:hypothetical protein Y032_0048g1700 [Ancylostoma ceylanicum]